MAILNLTTDVLPFLRLTADDSFGDVARVQGEIEAFAKTYCGRGFELTTYSDVILHNGTASLWLKDFPVTAIYRLAVGERGVMTVSNSIKYASAVVNVSTTGIILTLNGTDYSTNLSFATSTTLTTMVAAINAAGNGWSAAVLADYGSMPSTELLPRFGADAIDTTILTLYAPDKGLTIHEVDTATGEVTIEPSSFFRDPAIQSGAYISGRYPDTGSLSKIYAKYKAGYATMPEDLKLAILTLIAFLYNRVKDMRIGVESCSIEGWSAKFQELPGEAMIILNGYKKLRV